ncbi:putative MFS family arabinose efflux permease [Paracoccus pantotrophus]|uniref:MFS family arabinose efflux permease n=1 Tax=Paracoccus pantotrophus TaxID=82367 RepID=A0AAE6TUE4_PARPN|nr:MFS transporter [Paracoccus pantotrophus]QFG37769.1 MFS transporter [Paracoccus pantotrophus]RKS51767.1 putative MFS family arabinose efflux permease [Paracoccus pantotrophus]
MIAADAPGARRWPVISALGIVQIFAWGSSYYLLAVFAGPIAAETGWPLSWVVGGLSLGLFVAGMASPRVGEAIRRHGGRPVLALSSILLAAGLLIFATAPVLPVFVAGWIVLGIGMGAGLYDAAFATLGGIYGRKARSAITTLTLWGGFASTVCWPLSALFIEHLGWRWSCVAYALIQLGLCLPLILFVLPGNGRAAPAAADRQSTIRLSGPERRAYLTMMAIMVLAGLSVTIVSVHLLTMLQGRSLSLAEAVALGALIGPAQVTARLIEMAGGGRHHPIWTLAGAVGLSAVGLVMLALGLPLVGAAIFLYAAGNGIFSIAKGALPLALFGADRYAPIMGRLARPSLIAQAIAPTLGAMLLSAAGTDWTLNVLATLALANILLVIILWKDME